MSPDRVPGASRRAPTVPTLTAPTLTVLTLTVLTLMLAALMLVAHSAWAGQPRIRTTAFGTEAPTTTSTVLSASAPVPCAAGTTDLGIHPGYHSSARILIRLCAVSNLSSTAVESSPASSFYIKNGSVGANRHAIVNSRVSGAVYSMVRDMKATGLSVSTFSTYRSMERQTALCHKDARCRAGDYQFLAKPGTSNHQMGLAIDFTMPQTKSPGSSCAAPASSPGNPVWRWLNVHAGHYGFKQYSAEPWHWEALAANRC